MKKIIRILAVIMAATMLATSLVACGTPTPTELYIFNTKGENATAMDAATAAFTEETGVKVKVFSLGAGTDSSDIMRTEMNSKTKPAIFCVMNAEGLPEWVDSGYARNLNAGITEEFKKLVSDIPKEFNLTANGTDNYGIPFNVEGYGYVVDTAMLGDIFSVDGKEVATAIKSASYEEWDATVKALEAYIKDGTASTVTLSGQSFNMAETKTGKAGNLEGVFSTAGSQTWTYGDHMINVAINAVFPSSVEAANATKADVEKLYGPYLAYAKALDLKTGNAVTKRSPEFINNTTNGYDASVENLASGKAIFLKQGNWVHGNFANTSNPAIVDTLTFVPVKMPFATEDVVAAGRTVESINTSIPVFVPNYYVINAKVSEQEQKWAEQFLVWLNTSEAGKKFVTEDMAFIPYNADTTNTVVPNSLGNSILEYIKEGKTLSNPYAGAPTNYVGNTVGQYIMENYLTKAEWTEDDYKDIANYGVTKWIEMKNLK